MSEELETLTEENKTEGDEESNVIKTLRAQNNELKAAIKAERAKSESALADARSQLERENAAQRFMDAAGYPGLRDTVLSQVEGELTAEKALQALAGLSLTVDKEAFDAALSGQRVVVTETQSASSGAKELASVASLGGQISAAAKNTQESTFDGDLAETRSMADVIALAEKHGFYDPG